MTDAAAPLQPHVGRRLRRLMADQPMIPLVVLLLVLCAVLQTLTPGIISPLWRNKS